MRGDNTLASGSLPTFPTLGDECFAHEHLVFGVTELLENILLRLPARELLLARRIGRHFNNVMDGSSKIKQALFLDPQVQLNATEIALMNAYIPGIRYIPSIIPHAHFSVPGRFHQLPQRVTSSVSLNPILAKFVSLRLCEHKLEGQTLYQHQSLSFPRYSAFQDLEESPPDASWRSMLLLQPHAAPLTSTIKSFNPDASRPNHCLDTLPHFFRHGLQASTAFELARDAGWRLDLNFLPGVMISNSEVGDDSVVFWQEVFYQDTTSF